MKAFNLLLTAVIATILLSACRSSTAEGTEAIPITAKTDTIANTRTTDRGYDDSIMNIIDKITVRESISSNQLLYFSNQQTQDTFHLIIPAGPTSKTRTVMNIVNREGTLIFTDSFNTDQFIYYSDPEYAFSDAVNRTLQHIRMLTEPGFDRQRTQFFDTLLAKMILPHTKLPELLVYSDVHDQDLLDDVVADTDATILEISCFCYEGTSYVAYSKEKKKGVVILAHD